MDFCNKHCNNCISANCLEKTCPVIQCECRCVMHECKQREHKELICPEAEVDCPIKCLGCPLRIKRGQTSNHLKRCPANTVICNMQRFRLFQVHGKLLKYLDPSETDPVLFNCLIHDIALMRRLGCKMNLCEKELGQNPKRDEIESRIQENHGCNCGCWSTFYYVTMGDSEVLVTCQHVIRREEALEHRQSHLSLPQYLQGNSCPMRRYGCHYQPQCIEFDKRGQAFRFDQEICGLVVDWEPQENYEVDYDRMSSLPYLMMSMILDNLDGLSLRNLSMTSKHMREICFEKLYTNGLVNGEWGKSEEGWIMGRLSWSFSKVSILPQYHRNARISTEISRHLQQCKIYKKDRADYKSLPQQVELPGLCLSK